MESGVGTAELVSAIVALAGVCWWFLQRMDRARESMTSAYLTHVAKSTEAAVRMADAVAENTRMMREHNEQMAVQHAQICTMLPKRRTARAKEEER